MNRGYLALWRKFQDHPFWKEHRAFSKAEAWIDILWEVQHEPEPQRVVIGMRVFECHYAESLKSHRTWGRRWGWEEPKVRRFLKLLSELCQIEQKSEGATTRLKVLNYEQYDPKRRTNDATLTQQRRSNDAATTTDKNVKHVKNEKNKESAGKKPPAQTPLPDGFTISDRVKTWAASKGFDRLDQHLESFISKCTAKGYRYVDWDAALMNAIRDDWAKLRNGNKPGEPRPDEFVNIFEIVCLKTLEDNGEAAFLDACDQRNLNPNETRGKMAAWKRQILRG